MPIFSGGVFNGGSVTTGLDIQPATDAVASLTVSAPSGALKAWFVVNTNGASSASLSVQPNGDLLYQDASALQTLQATHDNKLGFFDHAPGVQPTGVAVTAAGIHAALVSLGLITA